MAVFGLPFEEVWLLDFEFIAPPGERQTPVCLVARELGSGRVLRLWADELGPEPPFRTDAGALLVAYFASAEWGCFLSLGWPLPARILDLYAEFRCETNGLPLPAGRGLLGALSHHALIGITKDEKAGMRELIMGGGPWSADERQAILDYCASDVDAMGPLLERMLPSLRAGQAGLGRALLRGRYSAAVAQMEYAGIPIDTETLAALRGGWDGIKVALIEEVDKDYGIYEGTTFKAASFSAYLDRNRIPWPRLESGALALDSRTFRSMTKAYPGLNPLKELRSTLGELRLMDLAVGSDGRNRTLLSPFASRTGRNQPSNSRNVFGPSVWIRNLIQAPEGQALAYLDWKSQEVAIAAALSGDEALADAVRSGDPYLAFAVRAGLAPEGASKASHPEIRDLCKVAVLGTNYGMGPGLLAYQTGQTMIAAHDLLRRLRRAFPVYFAWSQANVDRGLLTGSIETVLGWRLHVPAGVKPNSLLNFPMQANGAEMLRLAACLVTEAGITVNMPVHDALLIEAPEAEIADAIEEAGQLMRQASAVILDGWEIGTDALVIGPGERYADPRGEAVWGIVTGLLGG